MFAFHPRPNDQGQPVRIQTPSQATTLETWSDPSAVATCRPNGLPPMRLNGLLLAPASLDDVVHADIEEPPFAPPSGTKAAAGAVVVEPDARVWVVHPTNGFGGYLATFPKGRPAPGATLQETAVREVFEECGLVVEVFGFLIDSKRSTSFTRYYLARRLAGSPADMDWESQAVSLVPLAQLTAILNQPVDHAIVAALQARAVEWGAWFGARE